jgi:hypothetical protein
MTPTQLPVPVTNHPHWRVNFRPLHFEQEALSLRECISVVERAQVHLRGWDYPHINRKESDKEIASNYIAQWSNFMHHIEYWRFYQSTQFIHLFVIEEAVNPDWDAQLRSHAVSEIRDTNSKDRTPAFLSIDNFLYTVTEIFEFAARLTSGGLYQGGLSVSIQLNGIAGFGLSFSSDRIMFNRYRATSNSLMKTWEFTPNKIIADAPSATLAAVIWFFERFGWLKPPIETFRKDIQNYLAGKW